VIPFARPSASGKVTDPIYPQRVDLVERDRSLAVLRAAVAGAAAGEGAGVAVAGEPGIGKSTLIAAACRTDSAIRVLRASCDPLSTPRPLGPFRDLAVESGYDADLGRDDLMLSEICDHIFQALRAERTVLVVEDLHWVDAASVDVLRFLARRVSSMSLALLVSYRDHEIGPRHSARALLGDFARLDALTTLRLDALSVTGVGQVLRSTGLDPARVRHDPPAGRFRVRDERADWRPRIMLYR
jgi:predicted ATPase